jgi:anti-anti-sigma regulatory factor
MSAPIKIQAHIAYQLIDASKPEVVVVEFMTDQLIDPVRARELADQLESLIRPGFPRTFVIDFGNVRSLGSRGFGAIVSFARQVDRLFVCDLRDHLRLGSALSGLDQCAQFFTDRRTAINEARRAAMDGVDGTADYPVLCAESDQATHDASRF